MPSSVAARRVPVVAPTRAAVVVAAQLVGHDALVGGLRPGSLVFVHVGLLPAAGPREAPPARSRRHTAGRTRRGSARSNGASRMNPSGCAVVVVVPWRSRARSCWLPAPRSRSSPAAAAEEAGRGRAAPTGWAGRARAVRPRPALPPLRRVPVRAAPEAGAGGDRAPPARARRRRRGATCTSTRRELDAAVAAAAAAYLGVHAGRARLRRTRPRWGSALVYSGPARARRRGPDDRARPLRDARVAAAAAARRCAGSRSTTIPRRPRPSEMIDATAGRDHAAHEGRRGDLGALGHAA